MTKPIAEPTVATPAALLWALGLALIWGLVISPQSKADTLLEDFLSLGSSLSSSDKVKDDIFIPDNLEFYNPLKKADGHRSYDPGITGLENVSLYRQAENYRSNTLNSSQRALNHQWMSQYHHDDGVRHGSKVLSQLFKMGFKTYWKGVDTSNKYIPDDQGEGKIINDLDYRLRMSGNKIKLSLEYEF